MEGVLIQELGQYCDERGWLVEIFRTDESAYRPAMSYVSMTRPGIARGPHEHREQTDLFCFFGDFRLYLWDNRKESATFGKELVSDCCGRPHIAIIPPGVVHAYRNIGSADALVVNLPDKLFRGEGKAFPVDEIRYENDPDSRFRIEQ